MNDLLLVEVHHSLQDLANHPSGVVLGERVFSDSPEEFTTSSSAGRRGQEGKGRMDQ